MTYEDPIVKEVREIRRRHSEKYDHDLDKICAALRERERQADRRIIPPPVQKRAGTEPEDSFH